MKETFTIRVRFARAAGGEGCKTSTSWCTRQQAEAECAAIVKTLTAAGCRILSTSISN